MDVVVNVDSWIRAAIGGAMIGASALLLFALNGRIAGISGVLGGLVLDRRGRAETPWRSLFLAGLILGALLIGLLRPDLAQAAMQTSWVGLLAGGLLVGFGTRLGSGCTSGHGVCGIARLSRRSIVATLTFMAAGFATVFVLRHVLGGVS